MKFFKKIFTDSAENADINFCYAVEKLAKVALKLEKPQAPEKLQHSEALRTLAKDFGVDLQAALIEFQSATEKKFERGSIEYNKELAMFAYRCQSLIYSYQPQLMSAPGLWNQFKAYINSVMEKLQIIKAVFYAKASTLSAEHDFHTNFNEVKDYLKPGKTEDDNYVIWADNNGSYSPS